MTRSFIFILLATTLLSACGNRSLTEGDLPPPSPTSVAPTNGYPAIVQVFGGGMCSGVALTPHLVLTASHCLKNTGTAIVKTPLGRFTAVRKDQLGPGVEQDSRDIGVLYFTEAITGSGPEDTLPLGDNAAPGDVVRIIGYGCGDRRTGTNVIYRVADYIELLAAPMLAPGERRITGPENRASTCKGDSGGPALKQLGNGLHVVGILHAEIREGANRLAAYIDVTKGENRRFVEDALRR